MDNKKATHAARSRPHVHRTHQRDRLTQVQPHGPMRQVCPSCPPAHTPVGAGCVQGPVEDS
jgi:hypothetical protein